MTNGPEINAYNKQFLNNCLPYTFLLCIFYLPILSAPVDQLC